MPPHRSSLLLSNTPLSPHQHFTLNPSLFFAQLLYSYRVPVTPPPNNPPVQVVCISDTHNKTPALPNGDILLHAGDLTVKGTFAELQAQIDWLNAQPHAHKIVIGGNHDYLLDSEFVARAPERISVSEGEGAADLRWGRVVYLQDRAVTVKVRDRDIKVYGCPWTPMSGNWAFQYPPIRDVWREAVPVDTEILVSHGPPRGHLDRYVIDRGCGWLLQTLGRVRPKLVVFGHIHDGHGREDVAYDHFQRLYDGVCSGEKGWLAVIAMAAVWTWEKVWYGITRRQKKGVGVLLNAAVVGGKGNCFDRPPQIVEI